MRNTMNKKQFRIYFIAVILVLASAFIYANYEHEENCQCGKNFFKEDCLQGYIYTK